MACDRDIVLAMLERRGYQKADEEVTNPHTLAHKEFILFNAANGQTLIQFGPGRTGEENCHSTLYFDVHGDFTEHSCDHEDQESSDTE